PGPQGIPARIPRPPALARSSPQGAAPSGPVSLRTTGLDGVAVPAVSPHPLAAQWLRRPPLPFLPAPTHPPMAPGAAARSVARPLFPLGLHPPRRLAPAHPPEPSPALPPALRERQRHTPPVRPATLPGRAGPHGHPPHLGPEPHEPSPPPLPGHRRRPHRPRHLGRSQTDPLALPRPRRGQSLPGQVLRRAAPTPRHRQTPVPWTTPTPPSRRPLRR